MAYLLIRRSLWFKKITIVEEYWILSGTHRSLLYACDELVNVSPQSQKCDLITGGENLIKGNLKVGQIR